MTNGTEVIRALPEGEQPLAELASGGAVAIDTYAGRVHVEWNPDAAVTPLGQMVFLLLI